MLPYSKSTTYSTYACNTAWSVDACGTSRIRLFRNNMGSCEWVCKNTFVKILFQHEFVPLQNGICFPPGNTDISTLLMIAVKRCPFKQYLEKFSTDYLEQFHHEKFAILFAERDQYRLSPIQISDRHYSNPWRKKCFNVSALYCRGESSIRYTYLW